MKRLALAPIILLSGCTLFQEKPPVEKIVYVTTPLQLPGRPSLPTFTSDDVKCLTPEVKKKIMDRDLGRRQYAEELEVIIKSTQK